MTNPLLTPFELPPFSKIQPEHVVPAVTKALNDCRENVERVVAQGAPYTWENLCQPLAEVDDVLGRIFSPVSHLNSVKNSPELREAYEQTLPLLSEYSTWVGQHEGLYKAYRDLRDGDHYATLNTAQKKRSITRCAILSFLVLVCRRKNSSAMVKSPPVCLSSATCTAITSLMPRWAGRS